MCPDNTNILLDILSEQENKLFTQSVILVGGTATIKVTDFATMNIWNSRMHCIG